MTSSMPIQETSICRPLPPRRGWLRHGNRPGDYAKAPRCGARTRTGGCCRQPAMANGRCRMHGGLSTGPRTPEGLARSRRARWKHGFCSAEHRALRRRMQHTCQNLAYLTRLARDLCRQRKQSSLGMGFIERIRGAAGVSSGRRVNTEPCPLPSLPRADARRRVVDYDDDNRRATATDIGLPSSAKRGREGRGHGADVWDAYHRTFKDLFSSTSSLGMGFIEQNRGPAGASREMGALDCWTEPAGGMLRARR